MSHIPNAAIPHAGGTAELEREEGASPSLRDRAGKIAEQARAHPKTAVAAGAAVIAGVAAAAIPLVRGRKGNSGGSNNSGKGGSSRSRKKD
jgi:hypothetical protein